ncbi:MAG: reverse transcriptase domain-containing protein [Bacteroidota bacterium]
MQKAETVLSIIRQRGERGLPLTRVYRNLFNPDFYMKAYGRLYKNKGAMTPGATEETVDGMSIEKIEHIINVLKDEKYRWTPVRRTYIPKKQSQKLRALGLPTWSDKVVQEVLRQLLEAYFEPQFSDRSHGFRPNRGCHTALRSLYPTWNGTTWFIEGDIAQYFDTLNHDKLIEILSRHIHDGRVINLIRRLLQSGYLEDWHYHNTYSGTPQGGVISPLLANIYLNEFDQWVENTLIPKYTRGDKRKENPEYFKWQGKAYYLKKKGKHKEAAIARRKMQQTPSKVVDDVDFRRLYYVRYADDFLLGFMGSHDEAQQIKDEIRQFLQEELILELSEEKTLITHARTEYARFLGYDIHVLHNDKKRSSVSGKRINGVIGLSVPPEVVRQKRSLYMKKGKPFHRTELLNDSVYDIIVQYQREYRGIVEYYRLAHNLYSMDKLKWVMEGSLTRTLASKLKITVSQVFHQFGKVLKQGNGIYKGLQHTVPRDGKKPLVATWGGISLKRDRKAVLNDEVVPRWASRTELEQRLLAQECEICGATENIQVHHIRAMRDLNKHGRKKPLWVQIMAARQRKTLVLCHTCHMDIEYGRPGQATKTE